MVSPEADNPKADSPWSYAEILAGLIKSDDLESPNKDRSSEKEDKEHGGHKAPKVNEGGRGTQDSLKSVGGLAKPPKKYLYRGLTDSSWAIESTMQRRIKQTERLIGLKDTKDTKDTIEPWYDEYSYNRDLIDRFRHQEYNKEQRPLLNTDLGILAQIRHYGAAVSLTDFTGDSLIALWFACSENYDKDGVVYFLEVARRESFVNIQTEEQLKQHYTLDKILHTYQHLWFYWQPPGFNERILVQNSYFIVGFQSLATQKAKEQLSIRKIIIPKESKKPIRESLAQNNNIDRERLFPDMVGFAELNTADFVLRPRYDKIPVANH